MPKSKRNPVMSITPQMQQKMSDWAEQLNLDSPSDGLRVFFACFERAMDDRIKQMATPAVDATAHLPHTYRTATVDAQTPAVSDTDKPDFFAML
jgi:hypothetical protein